MTRLLLPSELRTPRYLDVAEALLADVRNGVYAPGSKLPNEKELAGKYGVSIATIRQGVGLLVRRRLVVRLQGKGTFISQQSGAGVNVGVALGLSLSLEPAHFYRALLERLREAAREKGWSLRSYDRMNAELFGKELAASQREMVLVSNNALPFSAMIEVAPPGSTAIPPELAALPRVTYSMRSDSHVTLDDRAFGHEAVRKLVDLGCRRIAFFVCQWPWESHLEKIDGVLHEAAANGLPTPEVHFGIRDGNSYEQEKGLFEIFRKLCHQWDEAGVAPDAVIFNDDTVLRLVAPILHTRKAIGRHPMIFSTLANEDVPFHYDLPVVRYEISPRDIARHLILGLEEHFSGIAPAPVSLQGRITLDQLEAPQAIAGVKAESTR